MKTKKLSKKIIIPSAALIVLVAAAALTYTLLPHKVSADNAASTASFAFDGSKAPGWWAGDQISSTKSSASTDPTASRNIVQGTQANPGDCFVTYSYYANNSKDPMQALSDVEAFSVKGSTLKLQPTNTTTYTMSASNGDQAFQLHQFKVVGENGNTMSRGEEFGFFKSGTGYVDIRGYCKTSDELTQTASLFTAVSFKN